MQKAKVLILIVALVVGGLVLELITPAKVQAVDVLRDTFWANSVHLFYFRDTDGYDVYWEEEGLEGKYQLNGNSLEMTFKGGARASATISGNKMSVRVTSRGSTKEFVLTKGKW